MKVLTPSPWAVSLPLFFLVCSSSQGGSDTDKAEVRAVLGEDDTADECVLLPR